MWMMTVSVVALAIYSTVDRRAAQRMLSSLDRPPIDPQTGLFGFNAFHWRTRAELKRAERFGTPLSLTLVILHRGDPVLFGRDFADQLPPGVAGFRLARGVFAALATTDPTWDGEAIADLATIACTDGDVLSVGTASPRGVDWDVDAVLRSAAMSLEVVIRHDTREPAA